MATKSFQASSFSPAVGVSLQQHSRQVPIVGRYFCATQAEVCRHLAERKLSKTVLARHLLDIDLARSMGLVWVHLECLYDGQKTEDGRDVKNYFQVMSLIKEFQLLVMFCTLSLSLSLSLFSR